MKIQKGLVKYKDRNDIVCTYGITDDGRQLYFLNDSKLSNDNVIVTTTLVEAIDSGVAHTHVGVTNQDGVEVVPCVNKAIKLITKDLLLVEPADPVSPFVIEANKNKKDPVEAQKLVNASATIKENIAKVMGNDGRYIFNDLFSEATLCDIDGNNLVNNNYYSFIAINKKGDIIYLAGNTKDSSVDSFSLISNKLNDSVVVNQDIVVPDVETAPVDVSQVEVEPVNLESEINPPVEDIEIETPPVEVPVETPPVDVPVETPPVEETPVDAFDVTAPAPAIPTDELVEDMPIETPPVENVVENVPLDVFETNTQNNQATEEEISALVNEIESPKEDYSPAVDLPEDREISKIDDEDKAEELDDEETSFEPLDLPKKPFELDEDIKKIDDSYNDLSLDDLLSSSNFSYKRPVNKESNIMLEAANTISKLIDVNSNQKSELNDYKDQVRQLTTLNKKVVDKARRDLDRVQTSISSKDNEIDLLKSRIQDIEAQLRDKERMINDQEDELSNLRSQVEGKRDLQKVLADADSYLGEE